MIVACLCVSSLGPVRTFLVIFTYYFARDTKCDASVFILCVKNALLPPGVVVSSAPPCSLLLPYFEKTDRDVRWLRTILFLFFSLFHFSASGQAVVTGVVPSSPGSCLQFYRAQGSAIPLLVDFSSSVLLTQALALSASQFVLKEKTLRIYTTRVCTRRGDSNSRNWPIPGPRIT